jgi:hypothetical protein
VAIVRHDTGMFQRLTITFLWFVAFFCLHEIAWSVFGSPRLLGIVAGALAAAFFFFDPKRVFVSQAGPAAQTTAR